MRKRGIVLINIAVLLFGMAGLFAKWIGLPALLITFGRVFFSSATLGIFLLVKRQSIKVEKRDGALLVFAGAILALHWWSFLEAIQLSTVAIGTITFSAFPLFVTLIEPLILRSRPERRDVAEAVMILAGVLVTVPEFSFGNRVFLGSAVGLGSALCYAVLTVVNRQMSSRVSGTVTAFYEQVTAAAFLLPFAMSAKARPSVSDLALLVFLGVVTTALAHTLFITGLQNVPATTAGLFSSLETVYSIAFAFLLLGEVPAVREVIGAVIIVGTVVISQLFSF